MSGVNKYRIALLVVDLRTTQAPQARGALRRGDGFCCLGRACEVSGQGHWLERRDDGEYGFDKSIRAYEPKDVTQERAKDPDYSYNTGVMPFFVSQWFGLNGIQNPALPDPSTPHYVAASNLNDQLLRSFSQIGDAFEQKYLDGETAEDVVARGENVAA